MSRRGALIAPDESGRGHYKQRKIQTLFDVNATTWINNSILAVTLGAVVASTYSKWVGFTFFVLGTLMAANAVASSVLAGISDSTDRMRRITNGIYTFLSFLFVVACIIGAVFFALRTFEPHLP